MCVIISTVQAALTGVLESEKLIGDTDGCRSFQKHLEMNLYQYYKKKNLLLKRKIVDQIFHTFVKRVKFERISIGTFQLLYRGILNSFDANSTKTQYIFLVEIRDKFL